MIRKLLRRFVFWCIEDDMVQIIHEMTRINFGVSSNAEGIVSLVRSGEHLKSLHDINAQRIEALKRKLDTWSDELNRLYSDVEEVQKNSHVH